MAHVDTDWQRYEPEAIRKTLPLEWAIGHLFNAWGAGAAMMPCPLPDHQDDTPSFNLWAEDEDGFPIRFGCFGCAANGDVVDAIRMARGVGFLEACRIAVEELVPAMEASDWQPAERVAAERSRAATHEELKAALSELPPGGDIHHFLVQKGMEGLEDYAQMAWGWRRFDTPAPTMAFPHRDWDRRLTGIRYRSVRRADTRWTERGSRFPALYGAWRDRGEPYVFLGEGETDTVWAGYQLERDRRPFDVMGLPAGAAQKPPEQAIGRLAGRGVFTAFDGDMAGRIATARWRDALRDVALFVAPVPIPEGEDVLSCGIPVADLIERAEA